MPTQTHNTPRVPEGSALCASLLAHLLKLAQVLPHTWR